MPTKTAENYFFFGLLFSTVIFTFFIFRPFWIVFVLGISFSIVLYPVYKWFIRKDTPAWISSLITVFLFIILLCGPLLGIGAMVFKQSQNVYHKVVNEGSAKPFASSLENKINRYLPEEVVFDINKETSDFISYVSNNIAKIFTTTLSAFFSFVLMLLLMFYFLKDGVGWRKDLILLSPLSDRDDEKIIQRLEQAVNNVIKGSLFIALIQGILMSIGLWIFGIPNSALWGVVAAIMSLIPTFGTALVSGPAIIFLFATGEVTASIGLLIWSVLFVGLVDNFLGPIVIGKSTNMPSILVLFSILGGIALLGPVGILVGPLALSLLYALISIYRNEFQQAV